MIGTMEITKEICSLRGFKYSGRPQFHSLVKKFNVFIEYMNGDKSFYEKEMYLCEKKIKVHRRNDLKDSRERTLKLENL